MEKALDRLVGMMGPNPDGIYEPHRMRAADALAELASTRVAEDADGDRALVVVHVDAEVVAGAEGAAGIEGGGAISPETARRLACDASIQVIPYRDGQPLGVGRRSRTPPPGLRRQVARRDQEMCCHPGCERRRHLKCHHVRHWTRDEGPTDLINLYLLCGYHHYLVHEGGWDMRVNDGVLEFIRPDGRVLETTTKPLRPEIRERLFGPATDGPMAVL